MSSLAAARADNFYHPPDWDPSKEGRNKYHGSHGALGDRARKLHEGILIIRFEMPFNVWCEGCGHLIGKGVRFNAEKKQIGTYHSTKIWSFTMRAPCCKQRIEVHTDPRNAAYVVVSGGRQKIEGGGEGEDGRVTVDPKAEGRPTDPISLLESAEDDKNRALEDRSTIVTLQEESSWRFRSDADNNRDLRKAMRSARGEEAARERRREQLGLPEHVTLAPETRVDRLRAAAVDFGAGGYKHKQAWKQDRKRIASSSIFSGGAVAAAKSAGKRSAHQVSAGLPKQVLQKARRMEGGVKIRLSNPEGKKKA